MSWPSVASIPKGASIDRIRRITIYHGAWLDSIATTYVLSGGSEFTCTTGRKGGRSSTYDFADNEILLAMGGLLGFIKVCVSRVPHGPDEAKIKQNTDILVDDLMIDYLQLHIKNVDTGEVRVVPEDPETFGCSQGADFFIQGEPKSVKESWAKLNQTLGPILALSGRHAGYISQIQPYLAKERDIDLGVPAPGVAFDDRMSSSFAIFDAFG